jgi:hypothetical protein
MGQRRSSTNIRRAFVITGRLCRGKCFLIFRVIFYVLRNHDEDNWEILWKNLTEHGRDGESGRKTGN